MQKRTLTMTARTLAAGQRSELYVLNVETGVSTLVARSAELLFEAPNWTPDGRDLLVNGAGSLHRVPAAGGTVRQVDLGGVPPINNDHVLSPDGSLIYVSAFDGQIYAVDLATAAARRVSNDRDPGFSYFLHGISPDGATLAYTGMQIGEHGRIRTDIYTIPASGGADRQLTDDAFADDGPEFSPDGAWIYFNSERGSSTPGHAQLFRMRPDGSGGEQLTADERVNWFPHVSPDGRRIAYVSFPPGTMGHPPDKDVVIRLIEDAGTRDLVRLFGGQGTINVASWSPDSTHLAYVAYPIAVPDPG